MMTKLVDHGLRKLDIILTLNYQKISRKYTSEFIR